MANPADVLSYAETWAAAKKYGKPPEDLTAAELASVWSKASKTNRGKRSGFAWVPWVGRGAERRRQVRKRQRREKRKARRDYRLERQKKRQEERTKRAPYTSKMWASIAESASDLGQAAITKQGVPGDVTVAGSGASNGALPGWVIPAAVVGVTAVVLLSTPKKKR